MNESDIAKLINFSCHSSDYREGEHFTSIHSLGMVISGVMELDDGQRKQKFEKGDLYSVRKNHLLKFVKYPPANGEFKSLTISFDEELLLDFGREYNYKSGIRQKSAAYVTFQDDKSLIPFMQSLLEYKEIWDDSDIRLIRLKQKEALILMLKYDINFKDVLFDFSKPYKIDLEDFMNKNYHFNVRLDKFAYLTGRSLATFKRDFQKTFGTSPRNWLQQKRLQEAHYLMSETGKTSSDVYLDLGFENLSHFSYAFKKQFGYPPSSVVKQNK